MVIRFFAAILNSNTFINVIFLVASFIKTINFFNVNFSSNEKNHDNIGRFPSQSSTSHMLS